MDAKNSYLALMETLRGNQNAVRESDERKVEFNDNYKQNHPAQTELISWLSNWRNQHGVVGKRKPLEREESIEQTQQVQPVTQRRKVVVRNRKLIDE
tara:strand:- start:1289 stop:1579 length:291 start_codon:yes stop_codon:yes gene_type:complete